MKYDLLRQHVVLILVLLGLLSGNGPIGRSYVVLFHCQDVFYLFYLLEDEDHLSLTLADLQGVCRILLVQLDQGLFKLQDLFVRKMDLSHHVLFFFLVKQAISTETVI